MKCDRLIKLQAPFTIDQKMDSRFHLLKYQIL